LKRKRIDTLAFFTTRELIEELVNRTTFVGVVVASKDEHKRPDQVHSDFDTLTTMGDSAAVVAVLKHVQNELENPKPPN
jgi:hypothetical protein